MIHLFSGPVGCGKSTALDVAEAEGYETVELGDVAREMYEQEYTDETISEWAERQREEVGRTYAIEPALEQVYPEHSEIVISGVRDPLEIGYVQGRVGMGEISVDVFWASQLERFQRLDRDKEYAQNFGVFLNRDAREIQWGIDLIIQRQEYDYWITNKGSENWFRTVVARMLKGVYKKTYLTPETA